VLKRILAWIEDYVDDVGIIGLAGPAMGILALGGALSFVIGNAAIKLGVLAAVVLAAVGLYVSLLTRLRELHKQDTTNKRLLEHYGDVLKDALDYTLHISYLRQVVVIAKNGDATETITVHAMVACKELHFLPLEERTGLETAREVSSTSLGRRAEHAVQRHRRDTMDRLFNLARKRTYGTSGTSGDTGTAGDRNPGDHGMEMAR
jgi:hypothetical protein